MLFSTISVIAGLLAVPASDTLQAVTVVADRGVVVSRTDTVKIFSSISISDALASIPGAFIMDNGGLSGLKTVSLRGLGSPHTVIYLDGVRVGNVQSGQTDLGMFDFANTGNVVLDYAQNSIAINTSKPVLDGRRAGGAVRYRGGSFGTYEPSGRMDVKLSDKVCMSATVSGVISKGDFPLREGGRRTNNDIRQIRTGLDSWGIIDGGDWHAKVFVNQSERGAPGTLLLPSTDRQEDVNSFLQGVVRKQFSSLYSLHASAKLSFDDLEYRSQWGDDSYRQKEFQLNTAHKFAVCPWMETSFAADIGWDQLDSYLYNASRTSVFTTASASFHPDSFKADIAVEYANVSDNRERRCSILSPSLGLRWNTFAGFDVLAFVRRAYRTPLFNELYYPGYGNTGLEPEDAFLSDVGVEYNLSPCSCWRIQAAADGFFNYLKNKIISMPATYDPNLWQPYNVGTVHASGADMKLTAKYIDSILKAGLWARYSFQNAVDRTSGSSTFGQQIPFVSRHAVTLGADALCKGWSVNMNWIWRGDRYDSSGRVPDFHTLDLTAGKTINLPGDFVLGFKLIARNLTDSRYELIGGYPMPGRAFYVGIDLEF